LRIAERVRRFELFLGLRECREVDRERVALEKIEYADELRVIPLWLSAFSPVR
jgi:hypothetical protein